MENGHGAARGHFRRESRAGSDGDARRSLEEINQVAFESLPSVEPLHKSRNGNVVLPACSGRPVEVRNVALDGLGRQVTEPPHPGSFQEQLQNPLGLLDVLLATGVLPKNWQELFQMFRRLPFAMLRVMQTLLPAFQGC